MLFHILVMKNIFISLKGFKVQLFVTDLDPPKTERGIENEA